MREDRIRRIRRRSRIAYAKDLPRLIKSAPWTVAGYVWPLFVERIAAISEAETRTARAKRIALVVLVALWDLALIAVSTAVFAGLLIMAPIGAVARDTFSVSGHGSGGSGGLSDHAVEDAVEQKMNEPWYNDGKVWWESGKGLK